MFVVIVLVPIVVLGLEFMGLHHLPLHVSASFRLFGFQFVLKPLFVLNGQQLVGISLHFCLHSHHLEVHVQGLEHVEFDPSDEEPQKGYGHDHDEYLLEGQGQRVDGDKLEAQIDGQQRRNQRNLFQVVDLLPVEGLTLVVHVELQGAHQQSEQGLELARGARQRCRQQNEAYLARQDHELPLVVIGFVAQLEVAVEGSAVVPFGS